LFNITINELKDLKMSIYSLAFKNMRRNKIRNISTVLRIGFGVLILLVLVGSGLGINSYIAQFESYGENNQTSVNNSSQHSLNTTIINYINDYLGLDLNSSSNPIFIKLTNLLSNLLYLVDGIASLAFLIGVLGVLTTMYFNEIERRREVGLLKILGFSQRQIFLSLALEGALLGFLSSLIGIFLGSVGLYIISSFIAIISLSIALPWWLVIEVIILTTLLSFASGMYPAWLASKNDAARVFREE
jgi:putative ABC transport system permease protein